MGAAYYVLVDDRSLIEIRRGVVGRGPDQFHSSLVGLLIRLPTRERRKKGVVNVHDPSWITAHEFWTQHLHVASQYHQVDLLIAEQVELPGLLLQLRFSADGDVLER